MLYASGSKVYKLLPPPFEWIEIPAGKVTLVNTWDDNTQVYLKKKQPQEFYIPAFAIAKYPVTNAQFAKFVEANGYHKEQWWTAAGWQKRAQTQWTEPAYWRNPTWNGADYPVVGICWYEALAFCRWLSAASGDKILLPTEPQWQRAAQGDDGRTYPWGNQWDGKRCNNSVQPMTSTETTPVTQYQDTGASPFGVVDMVGNVWEWCLNEYYSGKVRLEGIQDRVIRVSDWRDKKTSHFQVNYRHYNGPQSRNYGWGFRIIRAV